MKLSLLAWSAVIAVGAAIATTKPIAAAVLKTLILIIIGSICRTPPDPQTGAWGSHPEPSTHRAAAK